MSLGRQSLAATLSSPCPETPTDAPSTASPEELALMQQFLQVLGAESAPPTSTANRQTNTENRFLKRENAGKKAGKNLPRKDNSEEIQEDILWKKIAGMKDFSSLAGPHPRLDTMFETGGPIPGDKPLSEYLYEQSLKGNQEEAAP
jgi:hypothetical protein